MRGFVLLIFTILSISCTRKDETRSIDINVKLNDDVSPVEGEISIPGQFDYIDWTFEEIYKPLEDSPNPATHVFSAKGLARINVIAYKNDSRETFIGNTEISVPDVANKIKIIGFYIRNLQDDHPFNQKLISISLTYLKTGSSTARIIPISPAMLSPNDTIFFPEPVIYDIDGFENGAFSDYEIFIKISSNNDLEFQSSFNLTGKYFWEHPANPSFVYVGNGKQNQISAIYLICDWMPD